MKRQWLLTTDASLSSCENMVVDFRILKRGDAMDLRIFLINLSKHPGLPIDVYREIQSAVARSNDEPVPVSDIIPHDPNQLKIWIRENGEEQIRLRRVVKTMTNRVNHLETLAQTARSRLPHDVDTRTVKLWFEPGGMGARISMHARQRFRERVGKLDFDIEKKFLKAVAQACRDGSCRIEHIKDDITMVRIQWEKQGSVLFLECPVNAQGNILTVVRYADTEFNDCLDAKDGNDDLS